MDVMAAHLEALRFVRRSFFLGTSLLTEAEMIPARAILKAMELVDPLA
jgi:hypothetical protein